MTQKTLNRPMTQKTIWNIDSNQVMTQGFESTIDFVDFLGAFTQFRDLFWPFTKFRYLFWLSTHVLRLYGLFRAIHSSALIRISS